MEIVKPKTDSDPEVNNTLKILYVAPQLEGVRPLGEGHAEIIAEIGALRRSGQLTSQQKWMLDKMGQIKSFDDGYDF